MSDAPSIADARALLAAAVAAVDGVHDVAVSPSKAQIRPGYGWTRVVAVRPAGYRTSVADLEAVIVLALDELSAETWLNDLAVPLLDAATGIPELPAADASVEPATLQTGPSSSLFVLVVSITTEVQ